MNYTFDTLPVDVLHVIMSHTDWMTIIKIHKISSLFNKFLKTNLELILYKQLIIPNKYDLQKQDLTYDQRVCLLIKLLKFPFITISYTDFNINNIVYDDPVRFPPIFNIKNDYDIINITNDYDIINFTYNYGKFLDNLTIMGCKMKTHKSIRYADDYYDCKSFFRVFQKIDNIKKSDHYIMIEFDLKNDQHVNFINTINTIYDSCVNIIHNNKAKIKMSYFNKHQSYRGLTNPIRYHCSELDGSPIMELDPYMYLKVANNFADNIIHKCHHFNIKDFTPKRNFIPIINFNLIVRDGARCILKYEMIGAEIL